MKRIYQAESDDCMSCCIASILDIPLCLVPNFSKEKNAEQQLKAAQKWLSKLGWTMVGIQVKHRARFFPWARMEIATPAILCVKVKGKNFHHAVVGTIDSSGTHVLHDPYPNADPNFKYVVARAYVLAPAVDGRSVMENLRLGQV